MNEAFQAVVESLVSHGPLGGIVVLLCLWIWKLQRRLDSVQEKRVADAFKIVNQVHTFATALERNTETLKAFVEGD